jgi:exodeoxyribonuclease VII large subunit
LRRCLSHKIDSYKRGLLHIAAALQARSPARELTMRRNRLVDLNRRLLASPSRTIENARQRFRRIEGILRVLGPDATLRRGYSITRDTKGNLIRTISDVRPRMKIRTRVSDGQFGSEIL